jgi:hypothetical protein
MLSLCSGKTPPWHPPDHQPHPIRSRGCTYMRPTRHLPGTQRSTYFCGLAYEHSTLGPHNPSRSSAKPPGRLHWNLNAILIQVHCTNIVVNWTQLETLNANHRPHVLHHSRTLKPRRPLAIILGLCLLFTVLVSIKEYPSQGRQHANTGTSHRSPHTV